MLGLLSSAALSSAESSPLPELTELSALAQQVAGEDGEAVAPAALLGLRRALRNEGTGHGRLAALPAATAGQLADGLWRRDQQLLAAELVSVWLWRHADLAAVSLPDLDRLLQAFGAATPHRYQAVWRLAAVLQARYFDTATALGEQPQADLLRVVRTLAPDLDPLSAGHWAARLHRAWAGEPAQRRRLPPAQILPLAEALMDLDGSVGRAFLRQVLTDELILASLSPADQVRAVSLGCERQPLTTLEYEELALSLAELTAWDDARQVPADLTAAELCRQARMWWSLGLLERADRWCQAAIGRLGPVSAGVAELADLVAIASVLYHAGSAPSGAEFPLLTEHILQATAAPGTVLTGQQAWQLGLVLSGPSARAALSEGFTRQEGQGEASMPPVAAMMLAAWAYQHAGLRQEWTDLVEARLQEAAGDPDREALWLIGRAYAEEQRVSPTRDPASGTRFHRHHQARPGVVKRYRFLHEALGKAQSPEVRFQVAVALCDYHLDRQTPVEGLAVIRSVSGQFDAERQAILADLADRFRAQQNELALRDARGAQNQARIVTKVRMKKADAALHGLGEPADDRRAQLQEHRDRVRQDLTPAIGWEPLESDRAQP